VIETIRNAWKIPELRKKILFTVFALLIFRLGSVVPVPFIDSNMLGATLNNMGGIFTLLGAMNGTAFSMAAVFALGVQPYINSSIIIQLLTVAIPALERLQKEGGEEGRKKIAAITRYVTVAIGLLQGFGRAILGVIFHSCRCRSIIYGCSSDAGLAVQRLFHSCGA
jgi:preprotein translocase subunit SecY